jgi:hypothetical protein
MAPIGRHRLWALSAIMPCRSRIRHPNHGGAHGIRRSRLDVPILAVGGEPETNCRAMHFASWEGGSRRRARHTTLRLASMWVILIVINSGQPRLLAPPHFSREESLGDSCVG